MGEEPQVPSTLDQLEGLSPGMVGAIILVAVEEEEGEEEEGEEEEGEEEEGEEEESCVCMSVYIFDV